MFGIKINFSTFVVSLLSDKITKALAITTTALLQKLLTLKEAQSLIDYLSYYARVVRLRWVFIRPL